MAVANPNVETVYIVGAGFSHHAGLPLTSGFREAILEAREFRGGLSRVMVEFLTEFIRDVSDHPTTAGAKDWPELEDVLTCVDLSANSGHHLGALLRQPICALSEGQCCAELSECWTKNTRQVVRERDRSGKS